MKRSPRSARCLHRPQSNEREDGAPSTYRVRSMSEEEIGVALPCPKGSHQQNQAPLARSGSCRELLLRLNQWIWPIALHVSTQSAYLLFSWTFPVDIQLFSSEDEKKALANVAIRRETENRSNSSESSISRRSRKESEYPTPSLPSSKSTAPPPSRSRSPTWPPAHTPLTASPLWDSWAGRGRHAASCSPFFATSVNSFSDAPRGRFVPRSHWLTSPAVTFR